MKKIIKWGAIITGSVLVIWLLLNYRKCNKKGKETGKLFECNPFATEPDMLVEEEPVYAMDDDKCYKITSYGKKMTYKEVEITNCKQSNQ